MSRPGEVVQLVGCDGALRAKVCGSFSDRRAGLRLICVEQACTVQAVSDAREERLAKNETLFRTLNENIASLAGTLGGATPYEFICECASSDCFERILMTLGEYERVRSDGVRFLMAAAHVDIEIELIVEQHANYVVVEKDGLAGLVAQGDDPRG